MTPKPPTSPHAELASRILARRSLLPFVERINPRYKAGWVHKDICRRLEKFSQDVVDGKSPRLMLLMPPRSGKSELCSRSFPAWHLGKNPDHEIIACSYNVSLAMSFSKKVKEVLEDPLFHPVFDIRLNPNNQSAEEWSLASSKGGYVAAGVGGGITGKGAHLLIIDDPIKNAEEADSPDTREKLWDWYGSTAYTRLAPGGGVLCVQCMVGDTPVLMATGVERRLDSLTVGDEIATFDRGSLTTSTVQGLRSNGRDFILKITTSSGKIVRANGRHPFLVVTDGELKWMRARSLSTAQKIVTLKGSGESGKESLVRQLAALNLSVVEGCAPPTTTSRNGQTGHAPQVSTLPPAVMPTSSIGTVSPSTNTTSCSCSREASAPYVESHLAPTSPTTGRTSSQSITATPQAKSEGCCATIATQESDILEPSAWHLPQPNTSDFTLDTVVSVEPDGEEEVFDLQVARTENFIANGVVSHNTWWHDDDLAGRLQMAMAQDPDADQFTVVKYPAIAEHDEWLDPTSDLIVDTEPDHPDKILYRRKGEALHPDRYDLPKLQQIQRTISPRFWSALYQQNPVPDDGDYFLKEQFRRAVPPPLNRANVFIAWDFAISEKKLNDYTVGVVLLQDENDTLHVADMVRFKSGDALQIVDAILHLSKKWYTSNQIVGFEDGQIYRAISALLKKRMHEQRAYFSTQVLKPITDKLARARPLQGRMQQGRVSFDASADWYDACRLEMLRFPAGAHDDQCLIAGTLITMADGTTKPIEAVEVGEYVATPQGPCRVSAASMTNPAAEVTELGLSNGGTLTGTYGHPVWCPVTRMFVPLGGIGLTSKLEYHEIVSIDRGNTSWCGYTQNQSPASAWSSTEKFIAAIRSRLASTCGTISRGLVASTTSPFGSSTTVLCPMGTTSTTRTATRPTMTSPTSNAYLQHTTQLPTQDGAKARSRPSTSSGSARLPKHGTLLQRAWHGTLTMLASLGSTAKNTSSPAATAGRSSHPLSQTRSSAGAHAATSSGCVTTLNITSRKRLGARPVYNLTVDDAHVYYANGVLVHNCDALSWAVQLAIGTQPPRKAKVKPHKSWLDTLTLTGAKCSFMAA